MRMLGSDVNLLRAVGAAWSRGRVGRGRPSRHRRSVSD